MRWRFWQARTPAKQEHRTAAANCDCTECRRARGDCTHDFTNWTAPKEATIKVAAGLLGDAHVVEREMMEQTRTCLKCNLYERRYC